MNKLKKLPVNQIIHGDSIEVLSGFPEESIDMVMFSPPYWGLRKYGEYKNIWGGDKKCEHNWDSYEQWLVNSSSGVKGSKQNTNRGTIGTDGKRTITQTFCIKCGAWNGQLGNEPHPNMYINNMVLICKKLKRVLKKNGTMYIVVGDSFFGTGDGVPQTIAKGNLRDLPKKSIKRSKFISNWLRSKQLMLIPSRLFIALQNDGWLLRNKIIWAKTNPMPESVKDRYTTSYEEIGFFTKSRKYYFDMEAVLKPLKKSSIIRAKGKSEGIKHGYRVNLKYKRLYHKKILAGEVKGRHPRDVWHVTAKSYHGAHFAVYPEELCVDPILASCPKDGIVLDPMCGSGTTCVIAHKLGRRWIGIDLNKDYCDIARKRLESVGAYSKKMEDYI